MISEVERTVHTMMEETIESNLTHISKITKSAKKDSVKKHSPATKRNFAYYNWLWNRSERIGEFLVELPEMGYNVITEPYVPCHKIEFQLDLVQVDGIPLSFGSSFQLSPTPLSSPGYWQICGADWKANLIDCPRRVEIEIESEKEMELTLKIAIAPEHLYVTYPFGAEITGANKGHTLRFLWQQHGVVFVHTGTPYYKWTSNACTLIVPRGYHRFSISIAKTLLDAYHRAWEFFYPPQKIPLFIEDPPSKNMFNLHYNGTIPTALRKKNGVIWLRVLSIDGSLPQIAKGRSIDFNGNPTTHLSKPWKILNYRIT